MSRILFVMLHPGFIRYYERALHELAAAGHDVHVAFEISRTKLGEDVTARRLETASTRITCGTTPPRAESVRDFLARGDRTATRSGDAERVATGGERRQEAWESLATTVRLLLDYLRFFEPAFAGAARLRDRAEKRLPRIYTRVVRIVAAGGAPARRMLAALLRGIERIIPINPTLAAFVREQRPDLLLVTPLIELGSQQVDYVKCASRFGIRSALCVASWDNLTSKGLIRVIPDHVVVWNEAQQREAAELHGVDPRQVIVTGAQTFDEWFDATPTRSREEFCRAVGLDPHRRFVLYVGSSMFIAPDEVPFAERWISALRRSGRHTVASLGVLLRPHPANARQWRTFETDASDSVALWPPIGTDPTAPDFRRDYFESLYYSDAVVGINTSAQLEAGILGKPVLTICLPEFAHAQAGTLHFQHLVTRNGGLVRAASSLDEHVEQLAAVLEGPESERAANRAFIRWFIRPHGLEMPAAPVFARAIGDLLRLPAPPPRPESWAAVAMRPGAYAAARIARLLAEDRPLWVYSLRPVITAAVWLAALAYRVRTAIREQVHRTSKRVRRAIHRARHEATRSASKRMVKLGKGWKRAQGRAKRVFIAASSAHRRG